MANRSNHYESAFEAYLRHHRIAYVAVNERRRILISQGTLKNLDFIVAPSSHASLLIDVKGRRFPSGNRRKQYWRNWSTWDDLRSMASWQESLGPRSCAILLFAYEIVASRSPLEPERLFTHRNRQYAFLAIRVADYVLHSRPLSARWQTVAMPARQFRQFAKPFDHLLKIGSAPTAAATSANPRWAVPEHEEKLVSKDGLANCTNPH